MLGACHPFDDKGHVKICLCGASPILVYGGASCESSPSEAQSRKVVRLEGKRPLERKGPREEKSEEHVEEKASRRRSSSPGNLSRQPLEATSRGYLSRLPLGA